MKSMNCEKIIKNTILNKNYMTKGRMDKFVKKNKYVDVDKFDCYKVMQDEIENNLEIVMLNLREYEYDKNYKYFSLYNINSTDLDDLEERINSLSNDINMDVKDYLSFNIKKPTIKQYEDEIDIKFSLILTDKINGNKIKYPIIATIFKKINLLSIKYCSVSEDFYESEFYINTNNSVKSWIASKLGLKLEEFDSMDVFEKLYYSIRKTPDNHINESIHSILRDDEMNGRTYFRSSDVDMLPLIDELLQMVDTFECENDKQKLLSYIDRYESESIVRTIAIKWKNKFSNSRGRLGSITVSISKIYSVDNENKKNLKYEFILHHIHQNEGVNRERINYVIKYISNYSKKD